MSEIPGERRQPVATTKQKEAARQNLKRAREGQREGMSTAGENRQPEKQFAFPDERKEPLSDAAHVRNAIARFDQVEGVSDAERDRAWKRIMAAAKKFDVQVSADDWRELFKGGKAKKR
jgi:hypothetical protein